MEYFDIIDKNGNPTGRIVERSVAHLQGVWHRTAHVWVLRRKNDAVQILLQERASIKDSFPSCFDTSSAGHIPAGDDYVESALRELNEELGVVVKPEELIPCGERFNEVDEIFGDKPFHDRELQMVFILWLDLEENDFVLQKEEVDSVKWMNFDACYDAVKNNTIKHCIKIDELNLVKNAL